MSGKSLFILGAGWLAAPLALRLKSLGWDCLCTVQSEASLQKLENQGIKAMIWHSEQALALPADFKPAQGFCALPHSLSPESYCKVLAQAWALDLPLGWTLCSSTGVYGNPLNRADFDEQAACLPQRASSLCALASEACLQKQAAGPWHVLRLGGLWGAGREPARHLAGKQDLPQAQAPTNLLHLDEALDALPIFLAHRAQIPSQIFNVCSLKTSSREDFYTQRCAELGLPAPHFAADSGQYARVRSEAFWRLIEAHRS